MIRKLTLKEANNNDIPRIKRINVDCINAYELVVRDLLKMRSTYNDGTKAVYVGMLPQRELVVIFLNDWQERSPMVYVWPGNIDPDAKDDIITICSSSGYDGEISSFIDDYNAKEYTFWEFVQEQLY